MDVGEDMEEVKQELGEKEYQLGMELLTDCQRDFQEVTYIEAIDSLIEAFTAKYKRTEILDLLEEIIYRPNVAGMRSNYESNVNSLGKIYACIPKFEDLDFLILPVTKDYYRTYSKKESEFKAKNGIIIQNDELWTKLIIGSKEEILDAEFIAELEQKENDAMAFILYQEIYDVLVNDKQDERILAKIKVYHVLRPSCEKYDWMLGKYYYKQKAYTKAKEYALKAHKVRKFNFDICMLLGDIYFALGNYMDAIFQFVLMAKVGKSKMPVDISPKIRVCIQAVRTKQPEKLEKLKKQIALALAKPNVFPIISKMQLLENGDVKEDSCECFRGFLKDEGEYQFFIGLYNEQYEFDLHTMQLEILAEHFEKHHFFSGALQQHIYYDLIKVKMKNKESYKKTDVPYILPIAPTEHDQCINFNQRTNDSKINLGKYEFSYFRIDGDTKISSNSAILFGKPIRLQHSPKRKKLVLNILVDALTFSVMKQEDYQHIPNIMKFFSAGVIFNHNYTPSEWTYPSFAAIQTGRMPNQTQIFHPKGMAQIDPDYKTTAEYLNELGYHCTNIMGGIDGVFNNINKGFERVIASYFKKSYIGVERTIQHLEAFKETDNFIHLHVDDVHPIYGSRYNVGIKTQTSLPINERCNISDEKSVRAGHTALNMRQYWQGLRNVDRSLGYLFDFIQENYQEDEVIVTLCSDHGVPIFSENQFPMSDFQTGTALMVRGAGVPKLGVVENEVTNTIDLHSIMGHLLGYQVDEQGIDSRLPKAFGGKGREYAISNTLYPGQVYRMGIRDLNYAFCMDTCYSMTYDGRVNMEKIKYQIFKRNQKEDQVIFDEELAKKYLKIANNFAKGMHDPDFIERL